LEARGCEDRKAAMKEYEVIKQEVDRAALLGSASLSSNAVNSDEKNEAKKRFMQTNDKIEKQNATLERIQVRLSEKRSDELPTPSLVTKTA